MKAAKAKDAKTLKLNDPRLDPALDALNDTAGFLAIPDRDADAFDAETFASVEKMNAELLKLEGQTPDLPSVMSVADGKITKTLPIHIRGSYLTLGPESERGFPQVMQTSIAKPIFPTKQSGRVELARWLASSEHPLTARVFVNRVWRWHFGKGLVATTDNFGVLGDRPSHPELLDWLARRFIEDGWSVKDLHRLIMGSSVYQQSASNPAAMTAAANPQLLDPENRLLWRFNMQRLEAEQIRDSLFAISGWLDSKIGGKTVPLRNKEFVFNHTSQDRTTYESPRRAIYLPIIRNHLYDMLEQFDYPDPTMPTGSRNSTVVAPQALLMMNAGVVMDASGKFAVKLLANSSIDDTKRVEHAWLLAYARPPEPDESQRALAYVGALQRDIAGQAKDPELCRRQAWTIFCQTLFGANEFLYLR